MCSIYELECIIPVLCLALRIGGGGKIAKVHNQSQKLIRTTEILLEVCQRCLSSGRCHFSLPRRAESHLLVLRVL